MTTDKKKVAGTRATKKAKKSDGKDIHLSTVATPKKTQRQTTGADKLSEKKQTAKPLAAVKTKAGAVEKRLIFQLHFKTNFGQEIFLVGNHPLFGNDTVEEAIPMQYYNDAYWMVTIPLGASSNSNQTITYHYILKNTDGTISYDWGNDKQLIPARLSAAETVFSDTWNFAGNFENVFYTNPFQQVLLKDRTANVRSEYPSVITHILKAKSPLLKKNETLCVLGSADRMGNWDTLKPLQMWQSPDNDFFEIALDLSAENFPIAYKYGVYDTVQGKFIRFEEGNNRIIFDSPGSKKQTIIHDGFAILPNTHWKGAGVAIPVFSLRSENGLGIGEFTDIQLLVDWAVTTGLKMIQLLPINDTTASYTWTDSYPYAAISAFALHPIYLHIDALSHHLSATDKKRLQQAKKKWNQLAVVDYEAVQTLKCELIDAIYKACGKEVLAGDEYKQYFEQNRHWLQPYAVFSYLRDQYGTPEFTKWPAYRQYQSTDIDALSAEGADAYADIAKYYFVQYQLHLQLKAATAYAHQKSIILKGDIAIGVYRYGADAWQHPELFHTEFQAGAPPDDFAVTGQNWGFPTYNWEQMFKDGFSWWKQRFEQMSYYFDAFRIDHVLGFFRIWSIPLHAVEGVMGHFVPAIPVHINELQSRGVTFDFQRFTTPFINDEILWEIFGQDQEIVKAEFVDPIENGQYQLKPEFTTQRQVADHFAALPDDELHEKIKLGLYKLISNIILFAAEPVEKHQRYHFRIAMETTSSFRYLDAHIQQQFRELYIDYFYHRQDDFWKKEALQKLPALKRVTNMLICGEDLGMVPACVPDVMYQLGLLSLEIQRMPKASGIAFFNPASAPYLSVVTPSTHDMSTIRGWWEEDRARTQEFFETQLGQQGAAPFYCEDWINKAIVLQHLHSPAIWSIFQLQDLLGMDTKLRREHPAEERINIPANPKHYWQYRMHITLESLIKETTFNHALHDYIIASGRGE